MLFRLFFVLVCFVPLLGCGESGTRVLDSNAEADPIVSDDYYQDGSMDEAGDPTKFQ